MASTNPYTRNFENLWHIGEVERAYEIATSPENISWDGERPADEVRKAAALIRQAAQDRIKYLEETPLRDLPPHAMESFLLP